MLLLRREIFILWDLPGGKIEEGEDPAEAAARECMEETGYTIEVEGLVGRYLHPSVYGPGDQLTHVYRARATGGAPKRFGLETTELRWCEPAQFPRGFQPMQKQMVLDALKQSAEPFERHISFPLWKLYPARVAFIIMSLVHHLLRRLF